MQDSMNSCNEETEPWTRTQRAQAGTARTSRVGMCQWCRDWYGENYYDQSPAKDPRGTGIRLGPGISRWVVETRRRDPLPSGLP